MNGFTMPERHDLEALWELGPEALDAMYRNAPEGMCMACGEIPGPARMHRWTNRRGGVLLLCEGCAEDVTVCDNCHNSVLRSETTWIERTDETVCQRCYDYHYETCPSCGDSFHEDDEDQYRGSDDRLYCSQSCAEDAGALRDDIRVSDWVGDGDEDARAGDVEAEGMLHSYSFKPKADCRRLDDEPSPHLYLGVEIEREYSSGLTRILRTAGESGMMRGVFYAKSDGSLRNGAEWVSHPLTLRYWKQSREELEAFLDIIEASQSSGTSMHIHLSSSMMGEAHKESFHSFWSEHFWNRRLCNLCRRYSGGYAKVAWGYGGMRALIREAMRRNDRYQLVNWATGNGGKTVEVRGCVAPDGIDQFYRMIEGVHATHQFTRDNPVLYKGDEDEWNAFREYAMNDSRYPEFATWLATGLLVSHDFDSPGRREETRIPEPPAMRTRFPVGSVATVIRDGYVIVMPSGGRDMTPTLFERGRDAFTRTFTFGGVTVTAEWLVGMCRTDMLEWVPNAIRATEDGRLDTITSRSLEAPGEGRGMRWSGEVWSAMWMDGDSLRVLQLTGDDEGVTSVPLRDDRLYEFGRGRGVSARSFEGGRILWGGPTMSLHAVGEEAMAV